MSKNVYPTAPVTFDADVALTVEAIADNEKTLDAAYVQLARAIHVTRATFNNELEAAAKAVGGRVARGARATVASCLEALQAQFERAADIDLDKVKQTTSWVAKLVSAGIDVPTSSKELLNAYRAILAAEKAEKEKRAAERAADKASRNSHKATESGAATIAGDDADEPTTTEAPAKDEPTTTEAPAKDEPTTTEAPAVDVVAALDHLSSLVDQLLATDMTTAERARFASIVSRASRKTKSRA